MADDRPDVVFESADMPHTMTWKSSSAGRHDARDHLTPPPPGAPDRSHPGLSRASGPTARRGTGGLMAIYRSHTVSTAGLTAAIRSELAAVHTAHPRATARALCDDDAYHIATTVRQAVRAAADDDVFVRLHAVGGVVPNSYRGEAAADEVSVEVNLRAGTWHVAAVRGRARRAPYGRGSWLIAHAGREGQTRGRRLFSE